MILFMPNCTYSSLDMYVIGRKNQLDLNITFNVIIIGRKLL